MDELLEQVVEGILGGKVPDQTCTCPDCGCTVKMSDWTGITSYQCPSKGCARTFLFVYKLMFVENEKGTRPFYSIGIYKRQGDEERV